MCPEVFKALETHIIEQNGKDSLSLGTQTFYGGSRP